MNFIEATLTSSGVALRDGTVLPFPGAAALPWAGACC